MRPIRTTVIAVAALLAASVTATAAVPSPPTVPGWPKRLPAGTVLQGPQGGLVFVSPTAKGFAIRAFRRSGERLWGVTAISECGNCDWSDQPVARQADGTYGPIGDGDDFRWAVDGTGTRVNACGGQVFDAGGTCMAGLPIYETSADIGLGITGTRASSVPEPLRFGWYQKLLGYQWNDATRSTTFRDGRGLVYSAFRSAHRTGNPAALVPGVLAAVDPRDPVLPRLQWVVEGPHAALTGLAEGVLVAEPGAIAAFRPGGTLAWRRAIDGKRAEPGSVAFDATRGRLYVGALPTTPSGSPARVLALDPVNGALIWQTTPTDRARLLSVGRSGRVYLAIDRPGRMAIRAVRLTDGSAIWERRTGTRVHSAQELANGTVALSAGTSRAGRLTLVDPR